RGFGQQDPRHQPLARKMSAQKRFIAAHGIFPGAVFAGVKAEQPLDKAKLRPVRQGGERGRQAVVHRCPKHRSKSPCRKSPSFGFGRPFPARPVPHCLHARSRTYLFSGSTILKSSASLGVNKSSFNGGLSCECVNSLLMREPSAKVSSVAHKLKSLVAKAILMVGIKRRAAAFLGCKTSSQTS